MKIIEEIQLKNTIKSIRKYYNDHKELNYCYQELGSLELNSLQSFSFQHDSDFFDEVSFVLSVISSIVVHPHIVTKTEDIVLRAELAGHVTNDQFQKVMKEPYMWKQKKTEMVPEYIYHHQHYDELKIYENIFIGMIINLLNTEIEKYYNFYVSILPSIGSSFEFFLGDESIELALIKIANLQRKLRHIKNSYFYKVISKCNLNITKIQPTNILLKDRLYNHCFKFYRKFIQYNDKNLLKKDFRIYYYYQILKAMKKLGFRLDVENSKNINNLRFYYLDYKVQLLALNNRPGIQLTIEYDNVKAVHYLHLNTERILHFDNIDYRVTKSFNTIDILTIWNLYNYENIDKPVFQKTISEEEMATDWLRSKFEEVIVKKEIYSKYCPVCRSRFIVDLDTHYECDNCKTQYKFKNLDEIQDKIWFMRIRRL